MAVTVDRKSYYKIGELSKFLGLEPHIIRYWETLFPDIRPETTGTNRKLYTRSDLETLAVIRYLVREAQFSIEGAKQRIAELKRSGELSDLKLELVEYNDTKKTSSLAALNSIASRSSKKKDQDKTAVSDVVDEQIIQTPDDQSFRHSSMNLKNGRRIFRRCKQNLINARASYRLHASSWKLIARILKDCVQNWHYAILSWNLCTMRLRKLKMNFMSCEIR